MKSHKPLLQPTLCPTTSSLKHTHTRYLQLIWMIKRELKSPLLKLHLNVGAIWNLYLPLILDSIITKWKFELVTYRMIWRKNSPPGLDGSMKKIMPLLSKWSNEFARNDHYIYIYIFSPIHKMSHLGQPTVPIHSVPNLLAGTLWSCPTLMSTAISWDKVSKSNKCQVSLSFMIPAGKKVGL